MKPLLALLTALLIALPAFARQTTRSRPKARKPAPTATISPRDPLRLDTINTPSRAILTIRDYSKPLRTHREIIFVENHTPDTLITLDLHIRYDDLSHRELHQRDVTIPLNIPPHSTRQVTFRAWDINHDFYYRGNRRPPVRATPYDIAITATRAIYTH